MPNSVSQFERPWPVSRWRCVPETMDFAAKNEGERAEREIGHGGTSCSGLCRWSGRPGGNGVARIEEAVLDRHRSLVNRETHV